MFKVALVFFGAGLGGIARFKLSGLVLHHLIDWRFPLSTFLVNVLGCLVAGILAGLIERHSLFSPDTRLFLFTGVLGGFTTFSAFGVENVALLRRGDGHTAFAYVALSIICGLAVLWLGMISIPSSA